MFSVKYYFCNITVRFEYRLFLLCYSNNKDIDQDPSSSRVILCLPVNSILGDRTLYHLHLNIKLPGTCNIYTTEQQAELHLEIIIYVFTILIHCQQSILILGTSCTNLLVLGRNMLGFSFYRNLHEAQYCL